MPKPHAHLYAHAATTARPVWSAAAASKRTRCGSRRYGTVDELSSAIGVARAALRPRVDERRARCALDAWLAWTQDALFNLGSELATPPERARRSMPAIGAPTIAALERAIDEARARSSAASELHPSGRLAARRRAAPGAHDLPAR